RRAVRRAVSRDLSRAGRDLHVGVRGCGPHGRGQSHQRGVSAQALHPVHDGAGDPRGHRRVASHRGADSPMRRVPVCVAALLAIGAMVSPVDAQVRVQLQGIADGELWSTDTNSNLLSRNGGRPGGLGRMQAWGAIETVRSLVLYGMFETQQGKAGEAESEFEQYGLRYTPSSHLVLDAGKLPG